MKHYLNKSANTSLQQKKLLSQAMTKDVRLWVGFKVASGWVLGTARGCELENLRKKWNAEKLKSKSKGLY